MKKVLSILLALTVLFAMTACATNPENGDGETDPNAGTTDVQRLIMVTGGDAGTYYAFGGVIASVLTEKSAGQLEVTAVTSGASSANCTSLVNGEAELAIMQNDVLGYAVTGTETMADKGAMPSLRAIASLYPEAVQLVALQESGIQSVADLKGKKVCVGDAGSGTETNAKQVLEAYGLTFDDIDVQYLSFSEASTAMQNGTVDAAFATSALPNSAIVELTTKKDIVVVPIDGEGADALIAKYPFYSKTIIPADNYGSDSDVGTVAMLATLVCTEDLSEDTVYLITKTLFENTDALIAGNARGNDVKLENAKAGVTVDFHPGALMYFAEQVLV